MKRVLSVGAVVFLLAGCGRGSLAPQPVPQGDTTLRVAIVNAVADGNVTGVSATFTPSKGTTPITTSAPCAASGCTIVASAVTGGGTLRLDLTGAQGHVIHSGAMHVVAAANGSSVGVAFGGTPQTIKVSTDPGSFTIGKAAAAIVRVLAYDAQGNRMLGEIAFASPVTIASSDTSGTTTLSDSTITAPGKTLSLSYTGGTGSGGTTLTPSSADGAPVALDVRIVPPPHKTIDGNSSGDMTLPSQEEIDAIPTAPPDLPPLVSSIRTFAAAPASFDLSSLMPPVGDQGDENSCVGWASGYAIKSYQEEQEHKWALSGGTGPGGINTAHVFSPAYIYNQINGGQDNGSNFTDAFALLEKQGVAPWSSMPYAAGQFLVQPTAAQTAAAAPYVISTYYSISKANLTRIKNAISQGYPVFWGAEIDNALENGNFSILNGAFSGDTGGHAMTIVGYDDTKQAFKVMNSWGTSYEQGGFFWVSYDWLQNNGHMSLLYVLVDSLNDPSP